MPIMVKSRDETKGSTLTKQQQHSLCNTPKATSKKKESKKQSADPGDRQQQTRKIKSKKKQTKKEHRQINHLGKQTTSTNKQQEQPEEQARGKARRQSGRQ